MIIPPVGELVDPTEVRCTPCDYCPSAHWPLDPQAEEILRWPRPHQLETLFTCAWTRGKLCRGYCDILKVTGPEFTALGIEEDK